MVAVRPPANAGNAVITLLVSDGDRQLKLTETYGGSPDQLVRVFRENFDLPVNHYVEVNFSGFLDMVDLVGEIEICSWKTFESHHTDRVFEEGCHDYGKDAALDMVRQRYQFYDQIDYDKDLYGDYARQNFQQQAIRSLMVEAKDQGFLKDPTRMTELLQGFGDKVTVQLPDGLSMADLVVNLRGIDPESIKRWEQT
jgi:LCP family protein required for cell wall assembly